MSLTVSPPSLPAVALPQTPPRLPDLGATRRLCARRDESFVGLCSLVGVLGATLAIGFAGMLPKKDPLDIPLLSANTANEEVVLTEFTDAELLTMEEAAPSLPAEAEEPMELPADVEEPPEEIPEMTEAMVAEDVFQVPLAPRIDQVRTPVDPAKPKPPPKPRSNTPAPVRQAAARPAAVAGAVQGGGGGGTPGAKGRGGKGRRPKPSYRASVRARGIQGTVILRVSWDAAGKVVSAVVTRTMGSSEQDNFTASYVRQNWRYPAGAGGSESVPFVYQIR